MNLHYSRLTAAVAIARSVFGYPDGGNGASEAGVPSLFKFTSLICLKDDENVRKSSAL